jgi:hypothetical protein
MLRLPLMLSASVLTLSGCFGSTASDLPAPPAPLVEPCADPARLPVRALTQADVARFWAADRAGLRTCQERHGALTEWARALAGVR